VQNACSAGARDIVLQASSCKTRPKAPVLRCCSSRQTGCRIRSFALSMSNLIKGMLPTHRVVSLQGGTQGLRGFHRKWSKKPEVDTPTRLRLATSVFIVSLRYTSYASCLAISLFDCFRNKVTPGSGRRVLEALWEPKRWHGFYTSQCWIDWTLCLAISS
jgi:hypothetical protein